MELFGNFLPISLGVVSMIGWGVAEIFVKMGTGKIERYFLLLMSNFLFLLFAFSQLAFNSNFPLLNNIDILQILIFGTNEFIVWFLFVKAFEVGKPSVISPIISSYGVFTTIVLVLFFAEVLSINKAILLGMIFLGIILCSTDLTEMKSFRKLPELTKGLPYALSIVILYAITIPFYSKFIERPEWPTLHILCRAVTLVEFVGLYVYMRGLKFEPSNFKYFWVIILIGLAQAIGNISYNFGISNFTEDALIIAVSSAYPLVMVAGAYIFFKERVSFNQYIGAFLCICGVVMLSFVK